jgi:hypothetical protein
MFNNIIHGNTGTWGNDLALVGSAYSTHLYNNNLETDSIMGTGTWEGTGNMAGDPGLYMDGIHLVNTSPCIDAGTWEVQVAGINYYAPEFDFDKEGRPFNFYMDIGVDEWYLYTAVEEQLTGSANPVFRIFPNPVQNHATIEFEAKEAGWAEITLQDVDGKRLLNVTETSNFTQGMHQVQLNATNLKAGIYFCTLKTDSGTTTRKMVKVD